MAKKFPPGAFSWMMYDWANSAFATTVMAGFFPIFFGNYYSKGTSGEISTFWLGLSVSIAGIIVALSAPVLGAIADRGHYRKKLLLFFASMGIISTGCLYLVQVGQWPLAALLYILGTIGFQSGDSLYNSLLKDVSTEDTVDKISGLGFALGYLGGGLLFTINVLMTLNPQWFGLVPSEISELSKLIEENKIGFVELSQRIAALPENNKIIVEIKQAFAEKKLSENELRELVISAVSSAKALAVKISFLSVSLWWALFSLPLAFFVHERGAATPFGVREAIKRGFVQLRETLSKVSRLRQLALFLFAYWFYIDGVDTIIVMATKIGQSLGFGTAELITALLLVQFVGFPFAWLFGYLGQRFTPKPFIFLAIFVYMLVTILAYKIKPPQGEEKVVWNVFGFEVHPFFVIAFLIGSVQGGIQALSRSFYSRLIPEDKSGEFFGFYNMLGKFAAILGPIMVGTIGLWTGSVQKGLLSLLLLFGAGAIFLSLVNEQKAREAAREI
ncbi:MAG: MFS transporter [Leptospiraceae bacterium]|nr:MFS transporter [Leptospiraceae bacterium]MDW8307166.1 MFS transporter [Leptospiraceae bacterium]